MRLRRMIVMLAAVASLSLGLPPAMSAAYAASAAPAAHSAASVPAPARAAAASTAQTGRVIPLIRWTECQGLRTNWVDIDLVNIGAGVISDWCFGGVGLWRFSSNTGYYISNFCSGNNKGSFAYTYGGVYYLRYFQPGQYWAFPPATLPVSLRITGWTGRSTCIS
jgi:hypothetical protein